MNVVNVVSNLGDEASGPSYSVPAACRALCRRGLSVRLLALAPGPTRDWSPLEIEICQYSLGPRRLGRSRSLYNALRSAARTADLIHSHGLWMMPNVYPGWVVKAGRSRLVFSPKGTLTRGALAHSRWRKQLMWHLTQGPAIKGAACTFATAEAEVDDIRRAGLRGPIAVVPHGVDVPQLAQVRTQSIGPRRLVYFGRINWKKGIDYLLRAWREVEATSPDWELRIIGPDNDGYLRMMQELASTLSLKRAYFEGPAYGDEKSHIYRSASLFILPSRTENFGLAVAEALAHGVPAIVTHGAPWSGMTGHGCGWWIPLEHAALVQCLREVLSMSPGALAEAGARGRKWMEEDFSWDRVAEVTETTYRWILGGGPRPPWVTERR